MRHRIVILVVFLLMGLAACGGGGGGGGDSQGGPEGTNNPPVANAGSNQTVVEGAQVTLDGSGSTDADDGIATYAWVQTAGTHVDLSNASAIKPSFTAPTIGTGSDSLSFQLTVTDKGGLTSTNTCVITVSHSPAHVAEDVLYAAYAGIGYGNRDSLADDAPLYLVMVNDLNALVAQLLMDTIFNNPLKLLSIATGTSGSQDTFTDDQTTLIITRGDTTEDGFIAFTADLTVNFDDSGYSFDPETGHPCTYTGTEVTNELSATVTGYFTLTGSILDLSLALDGLWFKNVDIHANSGLTATYDLGTVAYDGWHIAYNAYYGADDPLYDTVGSSIPVNMDFIPADYRVSATDTRDYTVGGGFTMNGLAYTFTEGFHYQQKQYDYTVDSVRKTYVMTSLNGSLMAPGMNEAVTIQSVLDVKDPEGTDTIITHVYENSTMYDVWAMGLLTISGNLAGTTASVDVTFDQDGNAVFSGSGFNAWTVANWQETLAPF